MKMKLLAACLSLAIATPAFAEQSSPLGNFSLDNNVRMGSAPAPQSGNNIVQVAAGAGQFNTLLQLATIAELAGALAGPGPFTVFAPTDTAFAKIPANLRQLLASPAGREQLRAILGIHVIPGRVVRSSDLIGRVTPVQTLFGRTVIIDGRTGNVDVQGVRVVTADIPASNGIIHVVGTVLSTGIDVPRGPRGPRVQPGPR
jgi:uncharacterized surface protein with fasciclin (FAS1) repeats